ncbi:unnamed protein product [Phyllotreta striolata]|uniref:Sulfurtransferase n=1 Tax=Phyllotreta striolata TaxID=444603 RepID=A0A9N9XQA6_PHYSR|nr:unnamed protein product [Phyllotreta striolata]
MSIKTIGFIKSFERLMLFHPKPCNTFIHSLHTSPIRRLIETENAKEVSHSAFKKIIQEKNNNFVIDVRKPEELRNKGAISGSINVPLDELEDALRNLSVDEFREKYGINKPSKNHVIIFSCNSGNRSAKALEMADKLGYKMAKHYPGGWTEWEKAINE